jgi:integrase
MKKPKKTWTKSKHPNLYRHASGVYYARLTLNKRKTWRSLKTELFEVAKSEIAKLVQHEREKAERDEPPTHSGKKTFGQLAEERLERALCDTSTKASTKTYQKEIHAVLFRFLPELEKKDVGKVTEKDCRNWAMKHRENYSPVRFNTALGAVKQTFDMAIKAGLRMANPAKDLKRAKVIQRDLGLILPEPEIFARWIEEIRKSPRRNSRTCGDLIEFLAYTGLRPDTEARFVTWKHCDFRNDELVVTGDPENEGTKNRQSRRIPMNSKLRDLLMGMRADRSEEPDSARVVKVTRSNDTMKEAASKVGLESFTRYDLRHLFATRCLESGVDAPTLAKWMGHLDQGALVLRVYGHVRNPHSHAAAAKVSF